MNRKLLLASITVLVLCICLVLAGTGWFLLQSPTAARWIGLGASPTATTSRSSNPVAVVTPLSSPPLSSVSNATADALWRVQIPSRDLYQIVPRLRKNLDLAKPMPTRVPRARQTGERDTFFVVEDMVTGRYRTVTATLQVVTPTGFFWVENGLKMDQAALQKSAELWEKQIYPTNLKYFGAVGRGLDGEARVHILNARLGQGTAGYFSSVDTHPRALVPFSNERNIIYMDGEAVKPGSNEYGGVLAHEFQHLIHHYQGKAKTGWIDEGMGELAIKVNGFPVLGVMDIFSRNYDTQLNTWGNSPQSSAAHYAAAYLFVNYLAERYGPEFIRAMINAPRQGIFGVQAVLDQRAGGIQFDDLFADWAVTNYLNDPSVANGRYAYSNEQTFRVARIPAMDKYPETRTLDAKQYAGSYLTLQPSIADVTVYFTGTTTARLLPVNARGGQWMWYSNRADLANTSLTRQFDLSKTNKATLRFWTWYDIEKSYDYAYVQASTDGGKTWDILKAKTTTTENPNGASYGEAFTGKSGTNDERGTAVWIQEQVDLSPYAGKTILVRFEYITDDAYNTPGWAIDDLEIPEIGYAETVESGEGGWQAAGFIRTDNVLPQRYIVQVIQMSTPARVIRIPLDAQNRGNLSISGLGKDISRAVLVVTAHAPTTTEPTEYQVGVAPK